MASFSEKIDSPNPSECRGRHKDDCHAGAPAGGLVTVANALVPPQSKRFSEMSGRIQRGMAIGSAVCHPSVPFHLTPILTSEGGLLRVRVGKVRIP